MAKVERDDNAAAMDGDVQIDPAADTEPAHHSSWEPPLPFGEAVDPPAMPIDAFPEPLRSFSVGLAEQTQTPIEMPAMFALAVCSVTIAGRVRVRSWWEEPANLWTAIALDPANRKSSVFGEVVRPLDAAETDGAARMERPIREAKARKKVLEDRLAKAEAIAAKADPDELDSRIRDVSDAAEARDAVRVPVAPKFYSNDVTPEKLVGLLQDHAGRFAILDAEGGAFDMMAGRYTDGNPNVDVYLKGHAGDPIRVERMGRGGESVAEPALSVGLAIQPDVVRGLAEKPTFRGRGLLGRFLYVIPRSRVGRRTSRTSPMSEVTRREYHSTVRRLIDLQIPTPAPTIRFSAEANDVLQAFVEELEPRLADAGDLGHMADWAGKLAGAIVRISGVLHMVEHSNHPSPWAIEIAPPTVASSIAIGRCLLEHARTAFGMMGADPRHTAAKRVLGWLEDKESFVERDAFNALRGRFKNMDAFRQALSVLVEHGHIRAAPVLRVIGKPGRKPSTTFLVNPKWVRG